MHPWCFWVAALAHLLKTLRRPAAVIVYPLADRRPRFSTRGVNAMIGVRRDRDGSRLAGARTGVRRADPGYREGARVGTALQLLALDLQLPDVHDQRTHAEQDGPAEQDRDDTADRTPVPAQHYAASASTASSPWFRAAISACARLLTLSFS